MTNRRFVDFAVCRELLRLAVPLILSMTGVMLMQFVDGLFLARYSAEAVAAVGPASMAAFCLGSLVTGAVGYTSTLTAHYVGAGRPREIGAVIWQGIWLSLVFGVLAALLPLGTRPFFAWVGHTPEVQRCEVTYVNIVSLGMWASFLSSAIAGFFTGRGVTRVVMAAFLTGHAVNIALAYLLIFGRAGCPRLGIAGAAIASTSAQILTALIFLVLFALPRHHAPFGIWEGRRWNIDMLRRLLRFGLPNGVRFSLEIVAWTAFLFFIGRIGTLELASTSIAWRINGLAFFPVVGFSEALRILIGQALGRHEPDRAAHITWQGLLVSEAWMLLTAALFVLLPGPLFAFFQGEAADPAIATVGAVLLRFIAAYCLLDAVNYIVCGALVAAGDTRWTFGASLVAHGLFIAALCAADRADVGLYGQWAMATVFVMLIATVWLLRFHSGAWRKIRVIEPDPVAGL